MKKLKPGEVCDLAVEKLKCFMLQVSEKLGSLIWTMSIIMSHNKKQGGLHHKVSEL